MNFSLIINLKTILFFKYASIIAISSQNFKNKLTLFIITRIFAFVI